MTLETPSSATAAPDDIFQYGGGNPYFRPKSRVCRLIDGLADFALKGNPKLSRILAQPVERQRVLICGVEVPSRTGKLGTIVSEIAKSIHEVDVSCVRMKPQGKFDNINDAIESAKRPIEDYDWLVIVDDDVDVPARFLDKFIALATSANLAVSQPAHCFGSYASYEVTRRRFNSLVRRSGFVEIGPLTVLRNHTFRDLLPFPKSRWCWGIDILWGEIAQRNGWVMGIVDATPIRHLAPIASSYGTAEAVEEGRQMLERLGISRSGKQILQSSKLL